MEQVLIISILIFLGIISLRYFVKKIFKPKSELIFSFIIFCVPIVLINIFITTNSSIIYIDNYYEITFLYIFLCLCFLITVPAFNSIPPTLKIIILIGENKSISELELLKKFSRKEMLFSRIELMTQDKLILIHNGHLSLTNFGLLLAYIFYFYKKILGESEGNG